MCRLKTLHARDPVNTLQLSVIARQALTGLMQADIAQVVQHALQSLPAELQSQLNGLMRY